MMEDSVMSHEYSLDETSATLQSPIKINFSYETFEEILDVYRNNSYLSPTAEIVFILCYSIVITAGVVGNVMVGYVIWRKKTLRSPRNLYITNLTLSDLSMCVFCLPLTLVQLLHKDFSMGSSICKLIHVIQCSNILVSISTIIAIATDRYTAIVVGLSERSHGYVSLTILGIWIVSITFSLPLFFWYELEPVRLHSIILYNRCLITWPSVPIKYVYIITVLFVMYLIPIIVLSSVHASIKRYLDKHIMYQQDVRRAHKEIDRNRKTTLLLAAIAVVFAISWLPLAIVNLLADLNYHGFHDSHMLYTSIGSCHLIAMSTACTNPILYGWLNTNLRRELLEFFPMIARKLSRKRTLSIETTTKHEQDDSPTRLGESITYSTVILNSKHSPRPQTRLTTPTSSPLLAFSNDSTVSPCRRSNSSKRGSTSTGSGFMLTVRPESSTRDGVKASSCVLLPEPVKKFNGTIVGCTDDGTPV